MAGRPSPGSGLRLAWRLRKLVFAVWIVPIVALLPVEAIIFLASGPARANFPAQGVVAGDELLIMFETLRPVVWPIAVALVFAVALAFAWSVLWHGGVVRWWLGAGAVRVRLSEILGHGVVWWWRYARLWMVGNAMALFAVATAGLALRAAVSMVMSPLWAIIASGAAISLVAGIACVGWLATLRGAWLLGESGRRSAIVAWFRGLWSTLSQPLGSAIPLIVWMIPALALVALPVLLPMPWAGAAMVVAWTAAAFCWVALFASFAPQEPPEEWVKKMQARAANRAAKPREETPGYSTQSFPTQQ